jgi:hypothetical protein
MATFETSHAQGKWFANRLAGKVAGTPVQIRIDHQRVTRRPGLPQVWAKEAYINVLARDGARPGPRPGQRGVHARVMNVAINPVTKKRHVVSTTTVPLRPVRSGLYGYHYSGRMPELKLAEATYHGPTYFEQVVQLDLAGTKVPNPVNRSTWFDVDMNRAVPKK